MTDLGDSHDPYMDSRTGILRNLLGITDEATLTRVEASLTFAKSVEIADHPIPGDYDLAHLRAFHRALFADIYDWAGQLRTVTIARTEPFCLPQHVESYANEVFSALRNERHLCGIPRARFIERLGYYLGEVNALHPFREGNGRTQRAFFGQLAREAGWHIRWERADSDENDAASRASLLGDFEPLCKLIGSIVEPP